LLFCLIIFDTVAMYAVMNTVRHTLLGGMNEQKKSEHTGGPPTRINLD